MLSQTLSPNAGKNLMTTTAAPAGTAEKHRSAGVPTGSGSRAGASAALAAGTAVVLILATVSMFVGVSDVSLPRLLSGDQAAWDLFWISRLRRTVAVVLAGTAVAVAGLIMQLMARNRFVEPSTVGTTESATLGILVVTVLAPGAPLLAKMGVASIFAVLGTALF